MQRIDKAKREQGSCYECGSTDHLVRDCKKRKQTTAETTPKEPEGQISNVTVPCECDNEYRKRAEVQLSAHKIDFKFIADSQLDTACPISLIKARFIPTGLIVQAKDEHYEGINGSVLEVRGTVKAKIRVEDAITGDTILRVVPEHTMKCDILLGRDALMKLGLIIR